MQYPESVLSSGEEIVEHKHPHAKTIIGPVLLALVVLAGGTVLIVLALDLDEPWNLVAPIAIGVVGALVLLRWVLTPIVRWRTTHFVVTTDRVISREGLIKRTGIDIPMSRINSVQFEHTLTDRMFGCGSLIIESASEQSLTFENIPRVEHTHSSIYRQVNLVHSGGGAEDGTDAPHGTDEQP